MFADYIILTVSCLVVYALLFFQVRAAVRLVARLKVVRDAYESIARFWRVHVIFRGKRWNS